MAPTMPSAMLVRQPCSRLVLLTRLASQPASAPKISQVIGPMCRPLPRATGYRPHIEASCATGHRGSIGEPDVRARAAALGRRPPGLITGGALAKLRCPQQMDHGVDAVND